MASFSGFITTFYFAPELANHKALNGSKLTFMPLFLEANKCHFYLKWQQKSWKQKTTEEIPAPKCEKGAWQRYGEKNGRVNPRHLGGNMVFHSESNALYVVARLWSFSHGLKHQTIVVRNGEKMGEKTSLKQEYKILNLWSFKVWMALPKKFIVLGIRSGQYTSFA